MTCLVLLAAATGFGSALFVLIRWKAKLDALEEDQSMAMNPEVLRVEGEQILDLTLSRYVIGSKEHAFYTGFKAYMASKMTTDQLADLAQFMPQTFQSLPKG